MCVFYKSLIISKCTFLASSTNRWWIDISLSLTIHSRHSKVVCCIRQESCNIVYHTGGIGDSWYTVGLFRLAGMWMSWCLKQSGKRFDYNVNHIAQFHKTIHVLFTDIQVMRITDLNHQSFLQKGNFADNRLHWILFTASNLLIHSILLCSLNVEVNFLLLLRGVNNSASERYVCTVYVGISFINNYYVPFPHRKVIPIYREKKEEIWLSPVTKTPTPTE